jgi:hypothetical protein
MAIQQDQKILFLNQAHTAAITERSRTTSRGTKERYTIDIQQEAVGITVDEIALGKEIAKAIATAVADGIRAIGKSASVATRLRRKAAATAFARGEPWARDRYDPPGNRMGAKAPNAGSGSSGRMFTDSGRMADGMVSTPTRDGTYTINVAKGRLDPTTFKDSGRYTFASMVADLFALVPMLGDPAGLTDHPAVKAAMESTAAKMATKYSRGAFQVGKALADLARTAGDTAEALEEFQ